MAIPKSLEDALQLLSRIANSRTVEEAFDPPYRGTPLESFTFGPNGIKDLFAQEKASFSLEVDVELSQTVQADHKGPRKVREDELRYDLPPDNLPASI
jgi:hypothetical protein